MACECFHGAGVEGAADPFARARPVPVWLRLTQRAFRIDLYSMPIGIDEILEAFDLDPASGATTSPGTAPDLSLSTDVSSSDGSFSEAEGGESRETTSDGSRDESDTAGDADKDSGAEETGADSCECDTVGGETSRDAEVSVFDELFQYAPPAAVTERRRTIVFLFWRVWAIRNTIALRTLSLLIGVIGGIFFNLGPFSGSALEKNAVGSSGSDLITVLEVVDIIFEVCGVILSIVAHRTWRNWELSSRVIFWSFIFRLWLPFVMLLPWTSSREEKIAAFAIAGFTKLLPSLITMPFGFLQSARRLRTLLPEHAYPPYLVIQISYTLVVAAVIMGSIALAVHDGVLVSVYLWTFFLATAPLFLIWEENSRAEDGHRRRHPRRPNGPHIKSWASLWRTRTHSFFLFCGLASLVFYLFESGVEQALFGDGLPVLPILTWLDGLVVSRIVSADAIMHMLCKLTRAARRKSHEALYMEVGDELLIFPEPLPLPPAKPLPCRRRPALDDDDVLLVMDDEDGAAPREGHASSEFVFASPALAFNMRGSVTRVP